MRVCQMSRSLQIILSGLGLALIATALLVGCERENTTRIYGPAADPIMMGQWRGTVTAYMVSGGDTTFSAVVRTHYIFTDTNFTYRLVDKYDATIPPYVGSGPYLRNEDVVELQDTITYEPWVDRAKTPIVGEPYELTLTPTEMKLHWTHDYGSGIILGQKIQLARSK